MNIQTFDLNLLRAFASVYQQRNVSRAATAAGLSQPAMSNALVRLRRSCGEPLFVRTNRGMEPTPLAEQMIGPVRQALDILAACLEQPAGFEPERSERTFKLLMSDAGESVVLPALIAKLHGLAPRTRVEAMRLPHDEYASAMQQGHVDLALGNLPFLKSGFFQQRLFRDPYCCIVRSSHPELKTKLTLARYLAADHVSVSAGNADALVERELSRRRRSRDVKLKVTHYHVAVDIVRTTDLIATVPTNAARAALDVTMLPLPFKVAPAEVRQFWHRRAHQDPANQWLRALMASLELDNT